MLMRVGRRKSWTAEQLLEFCDKEFRRCSDLRPSVYEVSAGEEVRAHAEHYASQNLGPAPLVNYDAYVDGCTVSTTPGHPDWLFLRDRHREIVLEDEFALAAHASAIVSDFARRSRFVSGEDLGFYVRSRYDARDPKWVIVINSSENSAKWKKLARLA